MKNLSFPLPSVLLLFVVGCESATAEPHGRLNNITGNPTTEMHAKVVSVSCDGFPCETPANECWRPEEEEWEYLLIYAGRHCNPLSGKCFLEYESVVTCYGGCIEQEGNDTCGPDMCEGVVCDTPPKDDECVAWGGQLKVFRDMDGVCDPLTGKCYYSGDYIDCEAGCVAQPGADVCASPTLLSSLP